MKRLLILIPLLVALFAFALPAHAVELVFEDGCMNMDFTLDDFDFVPLNTNAYRGVWTTGVGWEDGVEPSGTFRNRIAQIILDFDSVNITSFTVVYDQTKSSTFNGAQGRARMYQGGSLNTASGTQVADSGTQHTNISGTNLVLEWEGSAIAANKFYIDTRTGTSNNGTDPGGSITIKHVQICGELPDEPLMRPLESQHEDPSWGIFDWIDDGGFVEGGSEYTVSAMSAGPGSPVHAVIDGTVTNVQKLTISKCNDRLGINLGILGILNNAIGIGSWGCTVFVPASITGLSGPSLYFMRRQFPPDPRDLPDLGAEFLFTVADMHLVEVEGSDGNTYEYFVKDPSVEEGQSISQGCILGITRGLTPATEALPILGFVLEIFTPESVTQGFATVTRVEAGDPSELLPDLTIYPGPNSKCSVDPEFADCFGDSKLESSSDWTTAGEVTWLEPGVQLGPNGGISSVFNLDPEREPQMRVSARAATGSPTLDLRLGDGTNSFPVTSNQFEEYELAADGFEPNNGLFYDIVLRNTASGIIEIEWVCISFTLDEEGEPEDPEGEPDPPVFPENCEVIEEPSGSDVGEWTAWHWHNLSQFFDCTLMVFLNTQYRTITDFFQTITWTIRWFMAVFVQGVDWMGEDFIPWLGGYLANASGSARATVTNNLPILPFAFDVQTTIVPDCDSYNDIGCYVGNLFDWLGSFIQFLFDGLLSFISDLVNTVIGVLQTIAEFVIDALVTIINGLVDIVLSIWDALVTFFSEVISILGRIIDTLFGSAIDFLEGVFNAAISIGEAIVSLFIWVIVQIIETIVFIRDLVFGIITAWNTAPPASIPGVTVCESGSYSIAICWAYWVLENTIFAGPVGGIILPLLTAIGIVSVAIRFVRDVRKTFLDTVQRVTA